MTQNEHLEPGLAELADLAALTNGETTDATAPHEQIATEPWTTLHRLGVTGRMLVPGQDAEVYAGLPKTGRLISPGTTAELIGRAPGPSWRTLGHTCTSTRARGPALFDLLFNNIPVKDLVLHSAKARAQHWQQHAINMLGSLGLASPGGLTILLASIRPLDDTESYVRREMSRATELIGALGVPAGTLRQGCGNGGTVDLILLHHREDPWTPTFTDSYP